MKKAQSLFKNMKKILIRFFLFSLVILSGILFIAPAMLIAQDKPFCGISVEGNTIIFFAENSNGLNWQFTLLKDGLQVTSKNGRIVNNLIKEGFSFWEYTHTISGEGNYMAVIEILDENDNVVFDKSLSFKILKPQYILDIETGLPGEDTVFNISSKNSRDLTWVFAISNKNDSKKEVFGDSGHMDSDSWSNSIAIKLEEGSYFTEFYIKAKDGTVLYRVFRDFDVSIIEMIIPEPFRPSGPFVPAITTFIPTPLDINLDRQSIKANFFFAILTMLPFAVASDLFTRIISGTEETMEFKMRKIRPIAYLNRIKIQVEKNVVKKLGRYTALNSIIRLMSVIFFYGLAFSLLDHTWKPFSLPGLVLFLYRTVAFGIVGIADDIIQWLVLKKLKVSAKLSVRPTNVIISILSILVSRLLILVPGLMFGSPEALRVDESRLDKKKKDLLLMISAVTFLLIGFGLWSLTIVTQNSQSSSMPVIKSNLVGGFQSFVLLVCAVALENAFVQMLGFTSGFGQALKRKNRWLWLAGLLMITFVFYVILINPEGELVQALQKGNVILFISVAVAFAIIAIGLWVYFSRKAVKNLKTE